MVQLVIINHHKMGISHVDGGEVTERTVIGAAKLNLVTVREKCMH